MRKNQNSLDSPTALPITNTSSSLQQRNEKPSPVHQQQLLHRQLNFTPEPRVLPPAARMDWIRAVDSQDFDGGIALEDQAGEARGWQ